MRETGTDNSSSFIESVYAPEMRQSENEAVIESRRIENEFIASIDMMDDDKS